MTDPAGYLVSIDAARIAAMLAKESRSQLAQAMGGFTKALKSDTSSVSRAMLTMHEHVAKGARTSIITAYAESGIGRTPSYRDAAPGKLKRYSRGAMERALKKPGLIAYDSRQLSFINMGTLDAEAKQWYRLNFGAGPAGRGGNQPKIKNWQMGRKRIPFTVSLASFEKSKNFRVPHSLNFAGVWSTNFSPGNLSLREALASPSRGKGGALYLVPMKRVGRGSRSGKGSLAPRAGSFRGRGGLNENKWSKGIRGRHFLEKGVDYINQEYPRQLDSIMNAWFSAATDSVGRRRPFVWTPI